MHHNLLINPKPTETDLGIIEHWLKMEWEKFGDGFYIQFDKIKRSFEKKQLIIFKQVDGVIGFMTYRLDDIHVSFEYVCIQQVFRGMGYGRMFFELLQEYFKSEGWLAISLFCDPKESYAFWKKMGFMDFPETGYLEPDLSLYKPIVSVCSLKSVSGYSDKIELWDVDPVSRDRVPPRYVWEFDTIDGMMDKPIIQPANMDGNIRWTKNGKMVRECRVKRFSQDNPINFSTFIYIRKLVE